MNSEEAMKRFEEDAETAENAAMDVVDLFNESTDLRKQANKTMDALVNLLRAHAPADAVADMREELTAQLAAYEVFQAKALAKLSKAFVADADLLLCFKDLCDNVSEGRLYECEVEMRMIDGIVAEASASPGTALVGTFDVMLMQYIFLELSNRDTKISMSFDEALQLANQQANEAARRRTDRSKLNAAKEKQNELILLLHEGKRDEAKQLLTEVKKLSFPCEMHANRMAKYLANAAIAIMVAQLNIDEAAQDPNTSDEVVAAMRVKLAQTVDSVHVTCVSASQVITLNEIIAHLPEELEWQVKHS